MGLRRDTGILAKHAKKNGISVEMVLINDYVESINLYTTGKPRRVRHDQHGRSLHPAAGGIDSTAVVVGDFSNGNDGIVVKNGKSVADLQAERRHRTGQPSHCCWLAPSK